MPPLVDLRVAELLCSRLCHELVSPIGAITNGVELLDEEEPDFLKDAVALIGESARKAGQRLQFYRFAYGSSGGAGEPADLLGGLFEGGKVGLVWQPEASGLLRDWQKLACNLALLAAEALPRGGTVTVAVAPSSPTGPRDAVPILVVGGEGGAINLPAEIAAGLEQRIAVEDLTARNVHACFTAILAEQLGARLRLEREDAGSFALVAATV